MKKLIIIEGQDRAGKSTLIQSLIRTLPNCLVTHWGSATGSTDMEKKANQQQFFINHMETWRYLQGSPINPQHLIWDRAHLGEYVYGTIYRDTQPDTWVPQLEEEYLAGDDVYMIYLCGTPEFLLRNDDGESFTVDIAQKTAEANAFLVAFQKSQVNRKLLIVVDTGDSYRPQAEILNQVLQFINS